MSYSRWSTSYWYTYWKIQDKNTENYDTAIFCICSFDGDLLFTAKELRKNISGCINTILMQDKLASHKEIQELITYINEFLKDVDKEYLTNLL